MKKRMAVAALGLGAAYLMRNKESREKLSKEFDDFNNTPMRGERKHNTAQPNERKKGLLGSMFN